MLETLDVHLETKSVTEGGEFEGYGAVFDVVDKGGDVVQKGAFLTSLSELSAKGRKPKMLWQHDANKPIGVYTEVREDDHGLYVKGRLLLDTVSGQEAHSRLKAGAIDGLSIGYRTIDADPYDGVRVLKEIQLWEVSLVTFPMNDQATVSHVKSLASGDTGHLAAHLAGVLTKSGFSKNEAAAASAAAVDSLLLGRGAGSEVAGLRALLKQRVPA